MCYSILTLWMPCCCCCCCIVMRWEGDPVILVLLELVDIPANGILPAERCWTPWWEPNCSVLSKEGKSSSRCICIPSPGPIWLMWLKLDGAEIILERRSLFLYILRKKQIDQIWGLLKKNSEVAYAGFEVRLFSRTENRLRVLGWLLPARLCPPSVISLSGTLTASQTEINNFQPSIRIINWQRKKKNWNRTKQKKEPLLMLRK